MQMATEHSLPFFKIQTYLSGPADDWEDRWLSPVPATELPVKGKRLVSSMTDVGRGSLVPRTEVPDLDWKISEDSIVSGTWAEW